MNTRAKAMITAVALAVTAAALDSRAQSADQGETAHQIAMDKWFAAERNLGSTTFQPVPFPVPEAPAAKPLKPTTAHEAAESQWFAAERNEGSTTFAPVPFPVPDAPAAKPVKPSTSRQTAESNWFAAERGEEAGDPPVPFPVPQGYISGEPSQYIGQAPKSAAPAQSTTSHWWNRERAADDGYGADSTR